MARAVRVLIIIILAIAVVFGVGFTISRLAENVRDESVMIAGGQSKSDSGEGGVTVTAEFTELNGQLVFDAALDTHFVDLSSLNPKAQFSLESDDGSYIAAERVESSGSEHHQEITLYFPKIQGTIRLVGRDIAGVPHREIIWPR